MKIKMLMAFVALLFSAFTADRTITIFMIGDSTMANKPLEGGNQERGWGHVLGGYFSENIRVENHARNGRSSKSFIDEGLWEVVINKVKPGDYVFIQFGHNDEKADEKRHTDPGSTFDANLRRFVKETRAKGGIPVAKELDVPFVDMNKITHDLVQEMGPEASKKLFMWIPEGVCAACPKGREDNTHLNVYGARTIAGLTVDAIAKEVPALAPFVRHYDFVVAKDGSGDFFTIQEAIHAVPDFRKAGRTTILVRKGVYKEKVVIPESKISVSLIGEDGAILTNDDFAAKKNYFGEEMSTSGSSTCYIYAPDFYAENITFENSAGRVGQAVACFVSGDRAYFKNCRFLGNQDTLYTYGKDSRQFYDHCYIEGTVDFIFGWSTALFKDCTIHSLGDGYVTAPSTDQGKKYGYVFIGCKLTGVAEAQKVYLSRPWRPYAQAVYIHCDLGKHILPVGWNNWGKKENEETVFYAEYRNTGEGAATASRASFGKQLNDISNYNEAQILAGDDGWNPVENGNVLLQNLKR